jgi:hypothetical protein
MGHQIIRVAIFELLLHFPHLPNANHDDMNELETHLQCQVCHAIFPTNELLQKHLQRFATLAKLISTWNEQCRAHLEPSIEYDAEPDDIDVKLCRDHPALLRARVCPISDCQKKFNEKKQLNIHFESRTPISCSLNLRIANRFTADFECTERCVVCGETFSHVSKLIAHTIHPEAIPRRQSYIKIARVEERKKAREKLHQMLIEAFDSTNAPKKRRSEEAGFEIQEQHSKKMKSLEDLNNGNISVSISEFEFNGEIRDHLPMSQLHSDPFAPPMFAFGELAQDGSTDPYAPPLLNYNY